MRKNKVLVLALIFSIAIIYLICSNIYASNINNPNDSKNKIISNQQTQVNTQEKTQINMNEKTSFEDTKKEIQSKIVLKSTNIEKNYELKTMISDNNQKIIKLRQNLRSKLVSTLQEIQVYKKMTDLTDLQIADIDKKIEIVNQVRVILQEQNQKFKDSIIGFRKDTSTNKIDTLIDIATAQSTRIDILQSTIELF